MDDRRARFEAQVLPHLDAAYRCARWLARCCRSWRCRRIWLTAQSACAAATPDAIRVVIKDFMFRPMQLTTRVGVPVSWVNQDDEVHTAISDTDTDTDTDMSYTFTFAKVGTYRVLCSLHPQMLATILVE